MIRRESPAPDRGLLQTVERALQLLELFTHDTPEWGLSDAARQLGLPKSVTFRLVETLAVHGYLSQNPDNKRYRLGLQLLALGAVVTERMDLRRAAQPHMEELAQGTGETVFLMALEGDQAAVVAKVDSASPIRVHMALGVPAPLTLGASNKVMLAFLPPERIERILAQPLPTMTGRGATSVQQLRQDLAGIRRSGWAYTAGEVTPDVAGLGVPILDRRGHLLGGLSLGGPASRLTPQKAARILPILRSAAQEIAKALGDR